MNTHALSTDAPHAQATASRPTRQAIIMAWAGMDGVEPTGRNLMRDGYARPEFRSALKPRAVVWSRDLEDRAAAERYAGQRGYHVYIMDDTKDVLERARTQVAKDWRGPDLGEPRDRGVSAAVAAMAQRAIEQVARGQQRGDPLAYRFDDRTACEAAYSTTSRSDIAESAPISGIVALRDDRVLLIQRAKDKSWDIPKGRVEAGETPAMTATREAREETGLIIQPERLGTPAAVAYQRREGTRTRLGVALPVRLHDDEPIRLSHEHRALRWAKLDALPSEMAPGYRLLIGAAAHNLAR